MADGSLARRILDDVLLNLKKSKRPASEAIEWVDDEQLYTAPDSGANSLALIARQMSDSQSSH